MECLRVHTQPTLAYSGNDLFVAWNAFIDESSHVITARYTASAGAPALVADALSVNRQAHPKLIANSTNMRLIWQGARDQLLAMLWNGTNMIEEVPAMPQVSVLA